MEMTEKQSESLAVEHCPALDILTKDGMDPELAATIIVAYVLNDGKDSAAFAEHTIRLRKAFREPSEFTQTVTKLQ